MQNPTVPQYISASATFGDIFKPTLATIPESADETREPAPVPTPDLTNEEPNK